MNPGGRFSRGVVEAMQRFCALGRRQAGADEQGAGRDGQRPGNLGDQ